METNAGAGQIPSEASPGRAGGRLLLVSSKGLPSVLVCVLISSDKDATSYCIRPYFNTSL